MKFNWKAISRRDVFKANLLPAIVSIIAGKGGSTLAEKSAVKAVNFAMPVRLARDSSVYSIAGAKAVFTLAGTANLTPIYTTNSLSAEAPNPLVANDLGRFPQIFLDSAISHRLRIFDAGADIALATPIEDLDPYDPSKQGPKGDPGSSGEGYSTRSALATAGNAASDLDDAFLTEPIRAGKFVFSTADLSAMVTADPEQGLHIAPESDPTGASGAWVRSDSFESIDVSWFGALGDGVTDDTVSFQTASTVAILMGIPLSVLEGDYRLSDVVTLATGLAGAGQNKTKFQAVNVGVKSGVLLSISGSGTYEDFTVDGAVSADPRSWNPGNYNSFTGWWPIEAFSAQNIILRNITAQNSAQAGIRLDACRSAVIDNCVVERSRNNFGDGFYINRSSNISLTNCKAVDVTRIGFVTEGVAGGTIELSSQISFTNCIAENAHDYSQQYGGGEFNSGFWSENTNIVTFTGCVSRNTGGRGFTYAATALNLTNGFKGAQAGFINCYADNAGIGFKALTLDVDLLASITFDSCVANECNIGIAAKNVIASIDNFQYHRDGGSNTAMAINADSGAHITVTNLFTRWVNQGAFPASTSSDSATISKFSSSNPVYVKVSGARTHDEEPITVKHRVTATASEIILEDANVYLVVVKCKKVQINNCNIASLVSGGVTVTADSNISNSRFNLSDIITLSADQGAAYHLDNCDVKRISGTAYLRFFNIANAESLPNFFVANSRFFGDIEAGGKLIQINGVSSLSGQARSLDLWLSNTVFVNTGSTTANVAIQLTRGHTVSNVFANGVWKSSSITSLATRTKTGSVVNDFD